MKDPRPAPRRYDDLRSGRQGSRYGDRFSGRKPWYLLTGFILGIILGLIYAWWISPVQYTDTPPSSLREDFKDQYRVLVSLSYAVNRNEGRARSRLALLDAKDDDGKRDAIATSAALLAVQAQRALAEGRPETESESLGILAAALGQKPNPPTSPPQTSTPATSAKPQEPTSGAVTTETPPVSETSAPAGDTATTPTAAGTGGAGASGAFMSLPTRTPTGTPPPTFVLKARQLICDPTLGEAQLQIVVFDRAGEALPGVQALIQWDGGQDVFTTGLKPEKGKGYADFRMEPEIVYSLHLEGAGETISGLKAEECQTSRSERYLGSWRLQFQQP